MTVSAHIHPCVLNIGMDDEQYDHWRAPLGHFSFTPVRLLPAGGSALLARIRKLLENVQK